MRRLYRKNTHSIKKLVSILIIFFLLTTTFSTVVNSKGVVLTNVNSGINKIKNKLEQAKNEISTKNKITSLKEKAQEITKKIKNMTLNTKSILERIRGSKLFLSLRTMMKLRATSSKLSLYTNYAGKEKISPIKLGVPASIDVDDDGDKDIRASFSIYPFIEKPLVFSFNIRLKIDRLSGFEDINEFFQAYAELTFPGWLYVNQAGDKVQFGYQSDKGDEVPDTCHVTYKYIPYIFYKEKPKHKVSLNPGTATDKDDLALVFSYNDYDNATDSYTTRSRWITTFSPSIKTEITFGGADEYFGRRFRFDSSKPSLTTIHYTRYSNGSEFNGGLVIDKISSFSFEMEITPFKKGGGRIEYIRNTSDPVDVTLFFEKAKDMYVYVDDIPQHARLSWTPEKDGLIELNTFDERIKEVGICDTPPGEETYNAKGYIRNLPALVFLNWNWNLQNGEVDLFCNQSGMSAFIDIKDLLGTGTSIFGEFYTNENLNMSFYWDRSERSFGIKRTNTDISFSLDVNGSNGSSFHFSAGIKNTINGPFEIKLGKLLDGKADIQFTSNYLEIYDLDARLSIPSVGNFLLQMTRFSFDKDQSGIRFDFSVVNTTNYFQFDCTVEVFNGVTIEGLVVGFNDFVVPIPDIHAGGYWKNTFSFGFTKGFVDYFISSDGSYGWVCISGGLNVAFSSTLENPIGNVLGSVKGAIVFRTESDSLNVSWKTVDGKTQLDVDGSGVLSLSGFELFVKDKIKISIPAIVGEFTINTFDRSGEIKLMLGESSASFRTDFNISIPGLMNISLNSRFILDFNMGLSGYVGFAWKNGNITYISGGGNGAYSGSVEILDFAFGYSGGSSISIAFDKLGLYGNLNLGVKAYVGFVWSGTNHISYVSGGGNNAFDGSFQLLGFSFRASGVSLSVGEISLSGTFGLGLSGSVGFDWSNGRSLSVVSAKAGVAWDSSLLILDLSFSYGDAISVSAGKISLGGDFNAGADISLGDTNAKYNVYIEVNSKTGSHFNIGDLHVTSSQPDFTVNIGGIDLDMYMEASLGVRIIDQKLSNLSLDFESLKDDTTLTISDFRASGMGINYITFVRLSVRAGALIRVNTADKQAEFGGLASFNLLDFRFKKKDSSSYLLIACSGLYLSAWGVITFDWNNEFRVRFNAQGSVSLSHLNIDGPIKIFVTFSTAVSANGALIVGPKLTTPEWLKITVSGFDPLKIDGFQLLIKNDAMSLSVRWDKLHYKSKSITNSSVYLNLVERYVRLYGNIEYIDFKGFVASYHPKDKPVLTFKLGGKLAFPENVDSLFTIKVNVSATLDPISLKIKLYRGVIEVSDLYIFFSKGNETSIEAGWNFLRVREQFEFTLTRAGDSLSIETTGLGSMLLDSFHTLLILNGEKAVQLDYFKLDINDYQFNLKLLFDLSGETLQFKAISASAAGSIAEIIIRDFYVNISVSTDNFAVILEEIKLNFSGQGSFYADIFEKDPDKFNIYASVTSPQGYINVKHFLLQITEFVLIEINDLNIQGKTIVSLYGHGTLLTNKKPSDIDYELRLAVNSPYWSLGRFHLEAFIFGYNKFFTFEQVTGNGEITLGLADWAAEFGLPQFMIVGVNGDFDWEHLIFYPDLLVAMGLLNESWRGVPIDSQHGSINGHIDLYIDFPNLIYGAVGNLTFKIVAYETTFIDILKYSIKGSYVSFINLEFHEGQGSISWHIPALYVFDYEENPKNTFEVRGSGTLNPKIGVCRVVNSKYNIDFTVSNLTLHIPYFLIELDAEKDITPETYLFIDTNNQYCEVNFEIVDLIKVFGVNFRTEDLRIDFDVDGDYEGFVRITNQNAEITGLSIEIFNHWKIFATGGWGNYAELTWNTDGNGVGTITLDTNNEPFHFDFLIMRILQIKGGFTAEDLVCDFDLNADGVGYIEVNDGTAVLDEFTWFLFIKWTISGSLPKHGKLEWNIDGDFNGHIFIDTDNENLEWTIYIYDRILCSGSFKAQDKLIEWDWTGHSIIPFHRSGTISFNPGEFEAAVCIQGDWYNILGGFDDLPVADAGGPYNGKINEVVTLDGSGSYSQSGADLEYRWDYDNDMWWDTDWSDSPTYEVAYSEAGEYEITLQVREKNSIFKQDQDTTTATILKSGMGTITGKVLDLDDYSPIRGATVETEDGNSTVTDADGNYELVVPYGDHTITASKDGYSTESKERYVPDGGSIEVYFHLQNLSNCYIQGFVYDASTGPGYDGIGDATVIANPGDYSVKTMNIGTSIGYYRIDLPPGTYTVTASKDGYQTRTEKNVVVPPGGYVSPLNFYLPPEATCIEGHVYDDENNPVSYATVATSEGSTKTNSKGYYLLEVSPGYQTVTASKDGYQSQSKNVNAIEGQTVTQDFILNRLEAEIFGFVKDSSTGHAISGVYVHTFSIDGATYSDYTDSNGFYSLTVIPNQGYTVAAEAEGYTAISHYVEENDLQDGSEQCNFELDPFTAGWRSPTGHSDPSNGWNDEYMAYDGNLNWAANSNNAGSNSWEWTSFLQLTLYEAIKCNKVRFYAYYNSQRCSKIDLDVYYSNAWHDCYEGSFASKQWVEKSVPGGEKSISKARVRFYIRKYLGINTRADLYEFEFYESGSGNGDGGDDDGGGGDTCCFPAGTMITMADGSLKPIENVKIGEYVLSYDIQSSQLTTCKVLETVSPIRDGVYNINNGLIQPTDDHPLFVKKTDGTTGWAAINPAHAESGYNMKPMQLEIGDKLLTSNGRWITIYSIEYTPGKIQTYNLEDVSGESNFFANGLLVHNATDCYEPSPGSDHNVE